IRACLDKRARPDIDTETVAYAIVGSIYFVVIQSLLWGDGSGMVPEDIIPMVLNGIDARGDFTPYVLPRKRWVDPEKPAGTQGELTRRNILLAAERLFGENGYHKTHTTDIARASGVGLGTIYLYFDSKKEILAELVARVNHLLRACSSEYARPYTDRREIENAGFQAFFDVFEDRGEDYRIVREAEFVEKSVGVAYYQKIAEPYARGLDVAIQRGEIIDIHPLLLSYALMGAGHTVGIRWYVIEKGQQLDDRAVLSMLQYVMHGVRGVLKETE
ncbi:MAG TPA: TetR/AcrR family transcriptional regulator, partial [Candidatus Cryosericum sp.]|nr:TetR/AcrR family transcriptional regulator [Candidatus Cryosericum sp.]